MTMLPDGDMPIDLLRDLVQLSSDAIIVADGEMRILAFNRAALDIFGLSGPEMRGKSVLDMVPAPARPGMQERLGTRIGGSDPALGRTFHSKFTRPDGKVIDVEHVVNTWHSGGKRYFGAIIRDISEWERAKKALEESEEKFRNVAEQSPNMIFINVKGRVVYANRRCEELMGYTREEFLSPSFEFLSITAPEYRALVGEKFAMHSKGIDVEPYEYAVVAKDGRRLDTILSTKLISYRGEKAILGTITDITERKRSELSLRESERFLESIFSSIQAGVSVLDREMRILRVNPAMERWYAHAMPLVGKRCYEAYHGRTAPCEVCPTIRALGTESVEKDIVPRRGPGREIIGWLELYSYPMRDSLTGQVRGVIEYVNDITEQKKAEEALRASEEKYRELVENMNDVLYSVGLDGTIKYVSPSIERVIGYRPEEIIGSRFSGLLHPDDVARMGIEFRRRVEGVVETSEYRLVAKGGGIRWASTTSHQLRSGGKVVGLTGVMTDITERRKTEAALRESEEKYRRLFESSPEGIVLLDLDGRVLDINRAALMILDLSRETVVGRSFIGQGGIYEEDIPRFMDIFRRMVQGELVHPVEIRVKTPKGDRWEEVFPVLLEKDGSVYALQVIMRDVTERRKTQREMLARLMEYELEEGNLYLVKEPAPVLSVQAFHDLLRAGFRGAVLSRTPAQKFRTDPGQQFDFRWISEKESAHTLSPDLGGIERWLDGLPRNMAVLVDRLDYLMLRNGLEPTLRFVHRLRDLAFINGHVVILSLDPATVGVREMHSLDRETLEIVPRSRPKLPDDMYDVLRHVYQEGAIGRSPTLTELRRDLDLSKPTLAKRVMNLVRGGYLALSTRGRTKQVELTEKGRRVFLK
jgi:PAS domain S-box-containing protein